MENLFSQFECFSLFRCYSYFTAVRIAMLTERMVIPGSVFSDLFFHFLHRKNKLRIPTFCLRSWMVWIVSAILTADLAEN
jgi:hypothetical protein